MVTALRWPGGPEPLNLLTGTWPAECRMVASDTVVGLVGAGILLVALVGVFVYESRQGGLETPELTDAEYSSVRKGSFTSSEGTSPPGPGGMAPCPAGSPTQVCSPPSTAFSIELTNLPDPGSLKYVVFLTGGDGPYNAGPLGKSGEKWTLGKTDQVDNTDKTTVVISLEKSATATSPGFPIMTFPTAATMTGTSVVKILGETGNHTISLTPSGNMLNVSAMIDDVPDKSGYEYHGWLKTETANGVNFTHVGKFGHPAGEDEHAMGKEDLVLAMNVNGTSADYNEFWVTIEPTGTVVDMNTAKPGGPAVITAAYNKYEPSATAEA